MNQKSSVAHIEEGKANQQVHLQPILTVGELRSTLEGMPQDCPVILRPSDQTEYASRNYYSVRAQSAFKASDKRFDQQQTLIVEWEPLPTSETGSGASSAVGSTG